MIQLQHVSKEFNGLKAVDNVSLNIQEGETVVLLGTSGCGKTTTLRMINRLSETSSGTIKVNGTDIKSQPAVQLRRNIGYVLQHHGLFPHYTVAANIAVVPRLLQWDKAKIKGRVEELLDKLRLPIGVTEKYPAQLSGGQQQRVGLARALAANPPVLLMDEPFGALDTVTRREVRKEFTSIDELKRKTILMVTHDVREAIELGDRICIMDQGKIVQTGSPRELLFNPVNSFVSSFLEEDRLRFELETITIKDVWQYLPLAELSSGVHTLSADSNLWRSLEYISSATVVGKTSIVCTYNSHTRAINTATLMAAFSDYKNSFKHE